MCGGSIFDLDLDLVLDPIVIPIPIVLELLIAVGYMLELEVGISCSDTILLEYCLLCTVLCVVFSIDATALLVVLVCSISILVSLAVLPLEIFDLDGLKSNPPVPTPLPDLFLIDIDTNTPLLRRTIKEPVKNVPFSGMVCGNNTSQYMIDAKMIDIDTPNILCIVSEYLITAAFNYIKVGVGVDRVD